MLRSLDLVQSIAINLYVNSWTIIILPGLLVLLEIASCSLLVTRCVALQQRLLGLVEADGASEMLERVRGFQRRLFISGYLSAFGALSAVICILAYSLFRIVSSANQLLAVALLFIAARAGTILGQVACLPPTIRATRAPPEARRAKRARSRRRAAFVFRYVRAPGGKVSGGEKYSSPRSGRFRKCGAAPARETRLGQLGRD